MDVNRIDNRTIVRVLAVAAAFLGVIWLAFLLRSELVIVGTSLFLAIALNPLVALFDRKMPGSRGLAVVAIIFALLLFIVTAASLILPQLVGQTEAFVRNLPQFVAQLQNSDSLFGRFMAQANFSQHLNENQGKILGELFGEGKGVVQVVQEFFHSIFLVITTLTLTAFMLIEGPNWLERFWRRQPEARRKRGQRLVAEMYQVVVRYVSVNLLFGAAAGLLVTALLLVLRVPFALPLGFITGILELIPLVGAIIAAFIVVVAALATSLNAAIVIAIFFFIYQHTKGNVLHPLVLGKTIPLSPLMILLAVFFGASLGGMLGALVAIPVGGCIQILIKDYLSSRG